MTIHHQDDHLTVHIGDCRDILKTLPAESVHCVVTSPPYWGLRDYGVAGALGLEPTPEAFIASMVEVFREVRRVLRRDGTLWLNMGDSYAANGSNKAPSNENAEFISEARRNTAFRAERYSYLPPNTAVSGLKPKDLVGMPWRLAFALQADGWYLRSDIIWSKPNPMPESVTDRPTKAHEYVFLLTKSARYFYDAEAVREPSIGTTPHDLTGQGYRAPGQTPQSGNRFAPDFDGKMLPAEDGRWVRYQEPSAGRNLRSVWQIATEPYPGAHFATFPQKLVEPCIKAGTSERGVCPECGAPWVREASVEQVTKARNVAPVKYPDRGNGERAAGWTAAMPTQTSKRTTTTGWRPSCAHVESPGLTCPDCGHHLHRPNPGPCGWYDCPCPPVAPPAEPIPATVLDPFAGSGTTGLVANRLGRRAILIDLSADYIDQAMLRNQQHPLGLIG